MFGAPTTSGGDADHAVAAALECEAELEAVNQALPSGELGHSVGMGISIHTGEVVAGNIGFEKKMDYTVIGDAVNIVFRLQALAKTTAHGILISESTWHMLRARPTARPVTLSAAASAELGGFQVYELIASGEPPAAEEPSGPGARLGTGVVPAAL
jgi:adenylate cyclase